MESEVEVRKCITLKLSIIMKKTDNYDEENYDSIAFHLIVTFLGPACPVFIFVPENYECQFKHCTNNLINNKMQVIRSWLARIFCKVNSFAQSKFQEEVGGQQSFCTYFVHCKNSKKETRLRP